MCQKWATVYAKFHKNPAVCSPSFSTGYTRLVVQRDEGDFNLADAIEYLSEVFCQVSALRRPFQCRNVFLQKSPKIISFKIFYKKSLKSNASMPEQVKRPNPWKKKMMMMMMLKSLKITNYV
jgi:hypothetical protein